MDIKPEISIVMPVYNPGNFLMESLDSIVAQSYQDWSLLCVDDGSDDEETMRILNEYCEKDKRIKCYRMPKNSGAAAARNEGLKNATGRYIIFLDADDVYKDCFLDDMYRSITENDADICICGHYKRDFTNNFVEERSVRIYPEQYPYLDMKSESHYYDAFTSPWNKLCRREFLEDYGIRFQNLKCSNDLAFSLMVMTCTNKIICCDYGRPKLYYRWNSGKQISSTRDLLDHYKAYCYAKEQICEAGYMTPLVEHQLLAFLLVSAVDIIQHDGAVNIKEFYGKVHEEALSHDVYFEDYILQQYLSWFRQSDNFMWCFMLGDFEKQLNEKGETLDNELKKSEEWIIWGNGQRSIALQKYLKKHDEIRFFVCESHEKNIGTCTQEGIKIISSRDIPDSASIIATNQRIYNMLITQRPQSIHKVVNLELYCKYG